MIPSRSSEFWGRSPPRVFEARGGSRPEDGSQGGMQREKRNGGGYTVSGNVSQVWEVSGADAACAAAGRLAPSRLDIMAGARSCCSAMVARCGSGPAAGDAVWACSNPRPSASVRLQTVGLGATRPCMPNGRRGPQMLAAWRRPPRGAPAGPKCPGRMRSGRPFKVVDARCGRARAQWPSGEHGLRAVARAFLCV